MQHRIVITGIESKATKTGNTKVVLLAEKGKYHFFQNQKGGSSPAFVQFQKFGFKIGDTVDLDSQDEEKSFTNEKGKVINFTEHWIQKFDEIGGVPSVQEAPQEQNYAHTGGSTGKTDTWATRAEIDAVNARIDKMGVLFTEMRKWQVLTDREIVGLKDLATDLRGKDAVNFHMPEKKEPPKDKWKFDVNKAKEALNTEDSHGVKIEMPEGL